MLDISTNEVSAFNRGVYSAPEALRLLNFTRNPAPSARHLSRQTLSRWLRGYDHGEDSARHSEPLWRPDYESTEQLEVSFRDLIELRFVKAFRDLGLGLPTIRECFERAVDEVQDPRPFSTQRFRTDGKTIFLEITDKVREEGKLIDLRRRQNVFRTIVEPSLRDLEFDAEVVARWFPLGISRRSIIVDPARAFGRPIINSSSVPTEVLVNAIETEGSIEKAARLFDVSPFEVRDARFFEERLAA
jgi:uncharacterized protein (DUF433 family)